MLTAEPQPWFFSYSRYGRGVATAGLAPATAALSDRAPLGGACGSRAVGCGGFE